MKRTVSLLAAAAITAVGPTIVTAPAAASVKVVKAEGFDFGPNVARIRRGDIVEWRFLDRPAPHNVRSRGSKRFRGSMGKQTGTHRVRFRRAGTYRYLCTIHPSMVGRVVVR